jgi:hypothetical protein
MMLGEFLLLSLVTMPLDVVKTRLMTQSGTGQYKGLFHCLLRVAKDEGLPALFRGVVPRVITLRGWASFQFFVRMMAAEDTTVPGLMLNLLFYIERLLA